MDFGQSDRRVELLVKTNQNGWDALNPQFMLYVDGILKLGMDVNHTPASLPSEASTTCISTATPAISPTP